MTTWNFFYCQVSAWGLGVRGVFNVAGRGWCQVITISDLLAFLLLPSICLGVGWVRKVAGRGWCQVITLSDLLAFLLLPSICLGVGWVRKVAGRGWCQVITLSGLLAFLLLPSICLGVGWVRKVAGRGWCQVITLSDLLAFLLLSSIYLGEGARGMRKVAGIDWRPSNHYKNVIEKFMKPRESIHPSFVMFPAEGIFSLGSQGSLSPHDKSRPMLVKLRNNRIDEDNREWIGWRWGPKGTAVLLRENDIGEGGVWGIREFRKT